MSVHDAASAVIEAARHAESIRDEASALKFYRVALRLGDVELQPEITAKIARLKLKIDAPDHSVRPEQQNRPDHSFCPAANRQDHSYRPESNRAERP
jgi:hypothetical protein